MRFVKRSGTLTPKARASARIVEGWAPLCAVSSAAMVLLPTPDSWARPYWEKPCSSLSSRSLLSAFLLEDVLIYSLSDPFPDRWWAHQVLLSAWCCVGSHFALPCGALEYLHSTTVELYPENTLRICAGFVPTWPLFDLYSVAFWSWCPQSCAKNPSPGPID